jgi:hypothetical protein
VVSEKWVGIWQTQKLDGHIRRSNKCGTEGSSERSVGGGGGSGSPPAAGGGGGWRVLWFRGYRGSWFEWESSIAGGSRGMVGSGGRSGGGGGVWAARSGGDGATGRVVEDLRGRGRWRG